MALCEVSSKEAAERVEEDFYLSDIHVEQQDERASWLRIQIDFPPRTSRLETDHPTVVVVDSRDRRLVVDSDGDFDRLGGSSNNNMPTTTTTDDVVDRRCVMRIEHAMDTPLSRVGLQMWRASFFLCDYVLNNLDLIRDKIVVDLGTGLGLTSFVTAEYAHLVFATDQRFVVKQARANWLANHHALPSSSSDLGRRIRFKRLNWYEHENFLDSPSNSEEIDDLDLNEQDLSELRAANVILAADVIYDDEITIKFMNTVYKLLTCKSVKSVGERCCIVANEKRINFSAMSLSAGDTAYDYFMTCLAELNDFEDVEAGYRFRCEEIRVDDDKLVKYVQSYRRNKFLYIWKIASIPICE